MATRTPQTAENSHWLSKSEQAAWRALRAMQMRLEAALNRQLMAESELSLSDYAVLVSLTDDTDGRRRLFELAEDIGWERSRLSHHVSRMAKRGLVSKQPCDKDRRGAFVVITDAGYEAIKGAAPLHVAAVRRLVLDQLETEELESMRVAAEKVLVALEGEATSRSERPDADDREA